MRDIGEIQDRQSLKYVIRHELKDLGIKVPKLKEKHAGAKQVSQKSGSAVFGVSLNDVSTTITNEEYGHTVPSFVVECVGFLENHLQTEGLFRKSGSQARQKELQKHIESRAPIPADSHLADVASLFKQFFRQLPNPLLTNRLLNIFIKCQQIINQQDREYATLLLTATMPQIHVNTLAYTMRFLNKVASHSADNKMDSTNLAVVLAPNFMTKPQGDNHSDKSMGATDKLLKLQAGVVQLLIDNAQKIGTVPEGVVEKVYIVSNKGSDITDRYTSADELEKSTDHTDSSNKWRKQANRRKRSKSSATIQGLMSGIGNRVRSRKNSCENVLATPSRGEVFHSPHGVPLGAETPRILRSSKRKASDESPAGAFSAAKRARKDANQPQWKALLHKMVVDPRYSKPGLTLHRTPADFGAPITPLRSPQPSLGEVDAVTQQGETLNFQSPSIKFADDSFTSFTASPAHDCAVPNKPGFSHSYTTPGRKKNKKLSLSSKKKRRSFGLADTTPSSQHTPRGMYRSIKRKLGHKPTHSQSLHCPTSPEKGVGYRLAGTPAPDGLDTLKFDTAAADLSIQLKRSPAFRRDKHRKTPSSPAMLLTKSFTTCEIPIEDSPHNVSLLNEGMNADSPLNTSSPKVVVVDMKIDPEAQMYVKESGVSTPSSQNVTPSSKSDRKAPSKPRRSGNLTPVSTPQDTPGSSSKKAPRKPRRSEASLTPVTKNLGDMDIDQSEDKLEESPVMPPPLPPKIRVTTTTSVESMDTEMKPSISQQSISSILSQASVDSIRSTFSIEECDHPEIVYDDIQITNTMPGVAKEVHSNSKIPAALGAMPVDEEVQVDGRIDEPVMTTRRSLSLESMDSALGGDTDMPQYQLRKSASIDSGCGRSIDDLMAMGVLDYKKPDGSILEAAPKSPLVKSLSASNMNSTPYGLTPSRLTRSQSNLPTTNQELDSTSTLNSSVVKANIQLFNSMSHTDLSSSCSVIVSNTKRKSKTCSALGKSMANAVERSYSLSNDEHYRRVSNIDDENLHPASLLISSSGAIELHHPSNKTLGDTLDMLSPDEIVPSITPMMTSGLAFEYRDHNDSYEAAISSRFQQKGGSLQVAIDDISTPRSLRKALGDHNVTMSPLDLEKVAKAKAPIDCGNEMLTPLRLAKSTRVRSAAGKNITIIRYSPSGKSSPGKAIKRLHTPASGVQRSRHHHGSVASTSSARPSSRNGHRTPSHRTPSHRTPSRRVPNSPKNPLTSPRYVGQQSPDRRPSSRMSSVPVHVEEEVEWKI